MAYLNPKEEVIEIQLTQHGKRLLSQGIFNPVYYTFVDEDVLYDPLCAGISQSQSDISDRIKESPQLNAFYNYEGVETSFGKFKKMKMLEKSNPELKRNQENKEEEQYNLYAIGDAFSGGDMAPALKVLFHNGSISGSVSYLSSSYFPHIRIPQIDSDIEFDIFVSSIDQVEIDDIDANKKIYDDGSCISVDKDYLLLELEEVNTNFEDENFEIEVFKVETDIFDPNHENLIPLHFKTVEQKRKNVYVPEKGFKKKYINMDENDVEYYLDILVDTEIDSEIMCKIVNSRKSKSIFVSEKIKCAAPKKTDKSMYRSSNEKPDDDCDF